LNLALNNIEQGVPKVLEIAFDLLTPYNSNKNKSNRESGNFYKWG